MKRDKKKHPSEYGQFAFRIDESDKRHIMNLIADIHKAANKHIADNEKRIKKNELVLEALDLGLNHLRKKYNG